VALLLADDLDLSRGDLLADATEPGAAVRTLQGAVCWLADEPRPPRTRVLVKAGARTVRALIDGYATRLDITTLERHADPEPLALNEIGDVRLTLAEPLPIDDYSAHRHTGGFLVIDEADGATLAAGMAGAPAGGVPRG
jgi:sulfate adenylyltransferase subunit 1